MDLGGAFIVIRKNRYLVGGPFILIRKNRYLVTLAVFPPRRNSGSQAQTVIFPQTELAMRGLEASAGGQTVDSEFQY